MATGPVIDEAIKRYVGAYETFAANGASSDPSWLRDLRRDAIRHFSEIGFPTTRQESWRFTNVKALTDGSFAVRRAAAAGRGAEDERLARYFVEGAFPVVVVNGVFAGSPASSVSAPEGVWVGGMRQAVREREGVVETHLGRCAGAQDNGFAALNTAFLDDGAFVHAEANASIERAIQILYVSTGSEQRSVIRHTRALIVAEQGSDFQLIETFVGLGDQPYCTSAVTEVFVGPGAKVDAYRIQRESADSFHIASTNSMQERDSRYCLTVVPLGARLARHDIRATLNGEGAEGTLQGLYVVDGDQHVDHNTVLDHAAPRCESHEYFNGILDGRAHTVFNGRIIVRPGAQKTDSKQTNNNLLLSRDARADSQPQLEIYADDVRCTHGATVGPIDENAMFYVRSRGVGEAEARELLTYGFSFEILERIASVAVRREIEAAVRQRLGTAGSGAVRGDG